MPFEQMLVKDTEYISQITHPEFNQDNKYWGIESTELNDIQYIVVEAKAF
jgi:hypothetical protein